MGARIHVQSSNSGSGLGLVRRFVVLVLLSFSMFRCASCIDRGVHPDAAMHQDGGVEYLNAGQCKQAEERFRLALEYGPNFEQPHNGLGMVELVCRNNLDEASRHFKKAITINPDFAQAHNNLGTTFFRRAPPRYDEACDQFEAAIEIDPSYLDARENLGMCLMRKGTIVGDKGEVKVRTNLYRRARSHLVRLLEMAPLNFNARHHLGFMDLIEGKFSSAEKNFSRCLEIDRNNPVCSYNLGNLYLSTARCEDAIQAFVRALRDQNAVDVTVAARKNLGVAYELCAKKDGAIKGFLNQIKTDPANPALHYDLANIYRDKGFQDQAVAEWEHTVELDPTFCAAYYDLAMHAQRLLDNSRAMSRCRDFIECASGTSGARSLKAQGPGKVEDCRRVVAASSVE